MLSSEDKRLFFEQGFIGPFKVYEPDEAKQLFKQIRIKSADMTNCLHKNPINYDRHFDIPELSNHIGQPAIVDKLRGIMGENLTMWRMEYFPKYPGSHGTEWHQVTDYKYATGKPLLVPTNTTPGVPFELTAWTCFTESTRENGCLKFMPGSHNKMYYDESKTPAAGRGEDYTAVKSEAGFYGYNFSDFKVDPNWEPDESKATVMEMKPGECVIFSARCMHASLPNTSKRSTRFAVACRYVQDHVKVYPGVESVHAHGTEYNLKDWWGCVPISGNDNYGYNKIQITDNLGVPFPVPT